MSWRTFAYRAGQTMLLWSAIVVMLNDLAVLGGDGWLEHPPLGAFVGLVFIAGVVGLEACVHEDER